jgi:D-alanyl-lipoteichoic acid acyltransferase DltB (MBOAT superfamily)
LFFTIIIDYIAGIYIEQGIGRKRKTFLIISILANVGVLAFFKYFNFFIDNSNYIVQLFNPGAAPFPYLKIILPIGLSFHTFQAMSYTIEVYRGHQKAERHFGIYALYVMFYPQLVAGPIERPQNMLHQFHEVHIFDKSNLWWGLRLMLWGLFKKAVIADRLSVYVNAIYDNPHNFHHGNVIVAAILFSFQIYCDFSGYSDMALGSAQTMGFVLMKNFDRPYLSSNIAVFWRRWHISLSTWFRDYLYISLGGNRGSALRRDINLMITFMVSGLWHGASWTFVIWGAIHGVCVFIYNNIKKALPTSSVPEYGLLVRVVSLLGVIVTFCIVTLAWVFFRAATLAQATDILSYMFTRPPHGSWFEFPIIGQDMMLGKIWHVFILFLILLLLGSEEVLNRFNNKFTNYNLVDSMWLGMILFLLLTTGVFSQNSFIYFQF